MRKRDDASSGLDPRERLFTEQKQKEGHEDRRKIADSEGHKDRRKRA